MKKVIIPQEENKTTNGQQKVMYASNEDGEFKTFKYGSSVEEYATSLAVEEYNILMEKSKADILSGKSSPIEYFMYKNRMDIPTLASVVGKFQITVKRHCKNSIFKKLNQKTLIQYADAFDITIEELEGLKFE
ncbi:hypothetical protein OAR97_00155 [Arcobacteraceae bacterium]|nr:hypothetical protein [Arcobacteraceae bacterium]